MISLKYSDSLSSPLSQASFLPSENSRVSGRCRWASHLMTKTILVLQPMACTSHAHSVTLYYVDGFTKKTSDHNQAGEKDMEQGSQRRRSAPFPNVLCPSSMPHKAWLDMICMRYQYFKKASVFCCCFFS